MYLSSGHIFPARHARLRVPDDVEVGHHVALGVPHDPGPVGWVVRLGCCANARAYEASSVRECPAAAGGEVPPPAWQAAPVRAAEGPPCPIRPCPIFRAQAAKQLNPPILPTSPLIPLAPTNTHKTHTTHSTPPSTTHSTTQQHNTSAPGPLGNLRHVHRQAPKRQRGRDDVHHRGARALEERHCVLFVEEEAVERRGVAGVLWIGTDTGGGYGTDIRGGVSGELQKAEF